MNRKQKINNNKKKEPRRVQDEKENSEREVFIEFESVVKDVVRILSRISLKNIC